VLEELHRKEQTDMTQTMVVSCAHRQVSHLLGVHLRDQRSDALDLPSWIPQSFLTIGLAVIALLIGVRTVLELVRPKPPAPPEHGELR
jgi:TRAP-type C4-dicarboxylate transport system permease small subunit